MGDITQYNVVLGIENNLIVGILLEYNYVLGSLYYVEDENYYYVLRLLGFQTSPSNELFKFLFTAIQKNWYDIKETSSYCNAVIKKLRFFAIFDVVTTISKKTLKITEKKIYPRPMLKIRPIYENKTLINILSVDNPFNLSDNVFEKIINRNIIVVGGTGTGKSLFTKKLIQKNFHLLKKPIIVFDIHGEYKLEKSDKVIVFRPKIHEDEVSPIVLEMLYNLSPVQFEFFYYGKKMFKFNWLSNLKKVSFEKTYFTSLFMDQTISSCRRKIEEILTMKCMTNNKKYSCFRIIKLLAKKGYKLIIFDLSKHDLEEIKLLCYNILWKIFKTRFPATIVIEELHNLLIEREGIIEKIFREGRKFGINIIAITQTPSILNQSILTNTDTYVIFRLGNQIDRRVVLNSVPHDYIGIEDEIKSLKEANGIFISAFWNIPIKFNLNKI